VAGLAAELEVAEFVAAAVVEGDAAVDLEAVAAAALDADSIATTDLRADLSPVPA
jgi:hypothetical protein